MQVERRRAAWMALELAALAALALLSLPFLASGARGPLVHDYGNIFLTPLFQVRAALLDGSLLTWDAERYGGTPYWGLPNTAPAYPPLLLALLLFEPVRATNLALLAHLVAGALGVRALSRHLGAGRFPAFAAAAAYLFAPLTRHFGFNQPWAVMALAYLPWTLLQVARCTRGADWRTSGIAAGLLYAGITWCGGYMVFLPGLMCAGLLALGLALRPPLGRGLARAAGMLLLLVAVFLAASAGRLLPSAAWAELTNRGEALPLADVVGNALTARQIGEWALKPGWAALALALAAVAGALARRRGEVLAVAFAVLCLLLLCTGLPQRAFLYEWAPGFDRARDPRNYWAPLVVLMPALSALGLEQAAALARRVPAWLRGALGALLLAAMCVEPVRFGELEPARIDSLPERLERNALHQELARRARVEPRFRVHDARDTRPKLKNTANLLRSALGLESIEGVLGNISIAAYDLDLIVPSRSQPARVWGFLNCRYVTSAGPLEEPELELVGTFAEDPDELFPGTDGPYLYVDRAAQPRAYLAPRAALMLDAERPDRERLLLSRAWSPRRAVLVAARSDALSDAVLARFDAVLDADPERRGAGLGERAVPFPPPGREDELAALLGGGPDERIRVLDDPERGWNRARLELPGDAPAGWLVLCETYAIYPGWSARVDGEEAPLYVANGAATALPLPAGARTVELAYMPPGLRAGLAVSAAGVALSLGALLRLRRRAPAG